MEEYWIGSVGDSRGCNFNKVAGENFTEKVTFEQRLK